MTTTELRTATVAADADMADGNILPMTKAAAGSGLFALTFAQLVKYLSGKLSSGGDDSNDGGSATPDENVGFVDSNPIGTHRYWRFLTGAQNGDGNANYCYLSGLDFLDANLASIASQAWSGSTVTDSDRAKLQTGDTGSYVALGALPANVVTDLTTAQAIGGVTMTMRAEYQNQAPTSFFIEGSDDNATWTRYLAVPYVNFKSALKQVYRIRPYIVQAVMTRSTNPVTFTELAYAATVGGNTLTVPATDSLSYARINGPKTPINAFDGVTTGDDYAGSDSATANIEYRFDDRPTLSEMRLTTRASYPAQAPDSFTLLSSRDGITYTQFYASAANLSWSANETKSFVLPTLAAPGGASSGSYITDAPSDGKVYGRKNGAWVAIG